MGTDPEAAWKPPAYQPDPIRAAARDEAKRLLDIIETPCPPHVAAQWLGQLGILTAGKMTADDAKVRLSAYAAMLEHSVGCFTKASLRKAATKFTWFPSFAEVSAFLDGELWWLKAQHVRLERIANAAPPHRAPDATHKVPPFAVNFAAAAAAVPREKPLPTQEEFERQKAEVLRQCEAAGLSAAEG